LAGYDATWKWLVQRYTREIVQEVVPEVAYGLAEEIRRQFFTEHHERLRSLGRMSEKLVYYHLFVNQPRTFTMIRRELGIGRSTVDRALRELRDKGFIHQDHYYQYWLTEPRREDRDDSPSINE